jgi:phospholipid N-methyltransferase
LALHESSRQRRKTKADKFVFRLPSFHPKVLLWRAATNIGPLPVLARARNAAFWQDFWRTEESEATFRDYAKNSALRDWLAKQCVALQPETVVELGPNVGANLQAIWRADRNIKLYGVELNDNAVRWGMQHMPEGCGAQLMTGSMADLGSVLGRNGIGEVDVIFSCGAAMHVNDEIFSAAKQQAFKLARKAIVHVEYNAWTPAELQNGRNWRSSFLSDRWIRDYVAEYEAMPGVARVDCIRIPPEINVARNIGRLWINDMTALIIVHRA